MVLIPAGEFMMGDEDGYMPEKPAHSVHVDAFYMDTHEVTNDQFAEFVKATGYKTDAEKWGWSIAFDPAINHEGDDHQRVLGAEWWSKVEGSDWRHPIGPKSTIEGKGKYPVVQVSWNDAQAYCRWAGKRLPTEAEWEYAARGGLPNAPFPWGKDFQIGGKWMANTYQGEFPESDGGEDGYRDLSPVGSYPPNGYGLYDMAGNVWEWAADWYDPGFYARSPEKNPQGPPQGEERIMRGGSWMCVESYCSGYRVAQRNKATPDSGLNNTGIRCVKSK